MKVPDVTRGTDRLSMSVEAGTWNIALISADTDIDGDVISPVRGTAPSSLKLWETQSLGGTLPSMPELRTAFIAGQQVLAGQTNTTSDAALLSRNVALVKVVIDDASGLDMSASASHKFELKDVPTTLNWAGGLYSDKYTPDKSSVPMTGNFTIKNSAVLPGYQCSDTLRFIIPAHKGTDYLNTNPIDTTEHHLKLSVDLACLNGEHFERTDVEIPRVPRANGILLVKLHIKGKVEVSADVLPWEDVEVNADMSQTMLYTDKASVGLAAKDTLHVNTNADDFTIAKEPGVDWLTVKRLPGNAIEITANTSTYTDNSPRTSYITITANNVTKRIPVTQRPDRGMIHVDVKELFMSPPRPTKSLNVTSIGGDWEIIGSTAKATVTTSQSNEGTSPVSFTRTTTLNDEIYPRIYGDTLVVFKNVKTLDTDTVRLSNLFIGVEDDLIEVAQPTEYDDTISIVDNVVVFGGNYRGLVVDQKPDWIYSAPDTYYDSNTGKFIFKCDREENGEERYGELILHHTDDSGYTVKVRILQDILVLILEFDYYTVKFTWKDDDVDIQCGFTGNTGSYNVNGVIYNLTVPFDKKFVGYGRGNDGGVKYNNQELIKWGGDARGGQGETFYFNAPIINAPKYPGQYGVTPSTPNLLPRKLKLSISATWYSDGKYTNADRRGDPITCTVAAYNGGTCVQNGTNFDFNGERVYGDSRTYNVKTGYNYSPQYFEFCQIEYDRKKHTAKVTWADPATRSVTSQISTIRLELGAKGEKVNKDN
ncbi:MAG: hypothetical protein LUE99_05045 [Bacteroides sp.]|nr:hypothetical protein [Bacteroides sp.]